MNTPVDLNAYFQCIGYDGGNPTASLKTLKKLHQLHTQAIPFENINPLLGLPVKLDTKSLQQKLTHEARGGYCFEQNILFKQVLEAIGFSVKGLAARVLWNKPEDKVTRRSHMLLQVDIEGQGYLADVGFGAMTLTGPLLLKTDKIQQTPHEPYRILKKEGYYLMQAKVRNNWETLYRFILQEQFLVDYEVFNWYLLKHPQSHFVTDLIAARPDQGRRYTLHNNKFKIHHLSGETKRKTLASPTELRNVLNNEFQLKLPESEKLDSTLERLIKKENAV